MGLDPDPIAAYRRSGYAEKIRAERQRRPAGRLGRLSRPSATPPHRNPPHDARTPMTNPDGRRAARAQQPARRRPAQHQLRRRQHLRQGLGADPVTSAPVELLWVKGSGGDLGTLTEPGLAVLRLDRLRALVERLPGRRARGRDGRRVRLLPARQGRRRPVDRHRDARPGRRRARRPPAPRRRHRDRDRRRRRGADQGVLRRPGRVGAVAAPRLPARPGHRRDQGARTRRPSA